MSLPAIGAGLDLDERVVRRHVAKLGTAGWLGRAPWVWGEGSVVWLTSLGVERTGLGAVRAVKAPPAPTTIAHGVLVGWSAARVEKRGRVWKSARELALDPERWEATMRSDRGYTKQLPDLAVWVKRSGPPLALVAESGGRREDRQKWILEGWNNAIYAGQYSAVLFDCADDSVARWISRLAKKARLTGSEFSAVVQPRAEEIATLVPAANDEVASENKRGAELPSSSEVRVEPARALETRTAVTTAPPAAPTEPRPVTPVETAERERRYREIFGIPERRQRRLWRR